ncbi:MAG: penicillin-binding protein activator LpoB [Gracilimonas sp.]|nr:penicillin-binding protein activator LpoB [Gracilimonas sp.]
MKHAILITMAFMILITGCRPTAKVTRTDPQTTTDLSGRWNETDARMVSEEMISDAMTKPWLNQYSREYQKQPVVIVGNVRNESMEHIDTEVISKEMERAFVNSGAVSVVASSDERREIRQERAEQQTYASTETMKAMAQELGADFILIGNISSIVDETPSGRTMSVFYTVNMELINVETNQKVWIGNKKIKKIVERRNFRG